MKKAKGFSLIEVIIYYVLFSFFSLLIFSYIQGIFEMYKRSKKFFHTAMTHNALSLFRNDVVRADGNPLSWKIEPFLVMTHAFYDKEHTVSCKQITWYLKKKNLIRCEGLYDFNNNCWKNRSCSVVCRGFSDFRPTLIRGAQQTIEGVALNYCSTHNDPVIAEEIYLLNILRSL